MTTRTSSIICVALAALAWPWPGAARPRTPAPVKLTRLSMRLSDQMGANFKLTKLRVKLDGVLIYHRVALKGRPLPRELPLFKGIVAPGKHKLTLKLVFRGTGLGIFRYMRRYHYTLRHGEVLSVAPGKHSTVVIRARERGHLFTRLRNRPTIGLLIRAAR